MDADGIKEAAESVRRTKVKLELEGALQTLVDAVNEQATKEVGLRRLTPDQVDRIIKEKDEEIYNLATTVQGLDDYLIEEGATTAAIRLQVYLTSQHRIA